MKTNLPDEIWIGREGEQNSRAITFDVSAELAMWENATPTLIYVRPSEKVAYPATTTLANGILTWIPDGFATAIRGARGFIQIIFTESADETVIIGKSKVMRMQICESLNTSAEPPEPWTSWIEDLLDAAAQATTAAENATEAAQDATDAAADARSAVQEAEATVSALNTRVTEVENELDSAERDIASIEGKVTEIIGEVTAEGVAQVKNVQDEGTTQIGLVGAEGTRQIGLVTDAGTTQIGLIEDKINTFAGIEILEEGETPQHESTEVTLTPDAEDIDQIPQIDDTQLSDVDTWSSQKIHVEDCFEVNASGTVVTVQDGADNVPVKELIVTFSPIQAGEGDPSPTNIRAISGRASVTIEHTGYNGFMNPSNNSIDSNGAIISSVNYKLSDKVPSRKGDTVTLQYSYNGGHNRRIGAYDAYDQFLGFISNTSPSGNNTFNLSYTNDFDDCVYVLCTLPNSAVTNAVFKSTVDEEIEVEFPQDAGIVYGGTLKINSDGSGVLTVSRAEVNLGNHSWSRNTTAYTYAYFYTGAIDNMIASQVLIDRYKYAGARNMLTEDYTCGYYSTGSGVRIAIRDDRYNASDNFKTSLNGVIAVIMLQNYISFNFTAQQVKTFLGYNSFHSDDGDISLTYRADKKLYVDTRLAELRALIEG